MPAPKPQRGKILRVDAPEWEPLLNLAPDHVDDFMWMGTVQLTDGTRLQMYKHYWTRGYLHLAEDGRAFVFVPKTRYEEVNPPWLLMRVLREDAHSDVSQRVVFPGHDLDVDKGRDSEKKFDEERRPAPKPLCEGRGECGS